VVVGVAVLVAIAAWDPGDDLFGFGYSAAALAAALLIYGLVVSHEHGPGGLFAWRPAIALGRAPTVSICGTCPCCGGPTIAWSDSRQSANRPGVRAGVAATMISYRLIEQPALRLKSRFAHRLTSEVRIAQLPSNPHPFRLRTGDMTDWAQSRVGMSPTRPADAA
jgi:hypothetical protein